MPDRSFSPATPRRSTFTWAASALILGTLLYILPSALHGNPPIESAPDALRYVADRPSWRLAHLANIAAVLIWAGSFAALAPLLAPAATGLRRTMTVVFTAAAAVFAVYFSIHAFGLSAAAEQYFADGANQAAILERAETILILLGSTAFTAQAMLGASIALAAGLITRAPGLPSWLGWAGLVAGVGWLFGALIVNFAVIVPFTALTWLWSITLGAIVWSRSASLRDFASSHTNVW
ncbi:uncharacterized protein DUF4386 [Tamaricihabitans halophyticus]|uniref:Uncharacterized protein DUF4386 n=1 Tax=Tamaricihabitans halophyticus TaxID=1262583 RepID=A0A4R2QXY5_9PSEU|nr:DUF4386 family protein [Tamaricihabitans halophyticus]TCP52015.1 uncharacterized protein DUF4386 [Tamaricihabitans halophyticus]